MDATEIEQRIANLQITKKSYQNAKVLALTEQGRVAWQGLIDLVQGQIEALEKQKAGGLHEQQNDVDGRG